MGLLKDITVLDKMFELNLEYLKQLDVYIAAGEQVLVELQHRAAAGARGRGARLGRPHGRPAAGRPPAGRHPLRAAPLRPQADAHDRRPDGAPDPPDPGLRPRPRREDPELHPDHRAAVEEPDRHRHQPVPPAEGARAAAAGHRHHQRAAGQERPAAARGQAKVGREVERGVVDVETLRKVNADLIATLEETIRIQDEGPPERLQAEGEIARLQGDLSRS